MHSCSILQAVQLLLFLPLSFSSCSLSCKTVIAASNVQHSCLYGMTKSCQYITATCSIITAQQAAFMFTAFVHIHIGNQLFAPSTLGHYELQRMSVLK